MLDMKKYFYTLIFVLFFIINIASGQNQDLNQHIIITDNRMTVEKILEEVENQTGLYFSYSSNIIDKSEEIHLDSEQVRVDELLNILFDDKPIAYRQLGKQIVLYEKELDEPSKPIKPRDNETVKNKSAQIQTTEDKTPEITVVNDTVYQYINTTKVKVYDTVRYVFHDTIRHEIKPDIPDMSLETGFGPLLRFPSLKPNSAQYSDDLDLIKESEDNGFSYNFYLNYEVSINRSLKFGTGLIFSRHKSKMKYDFNNVQTKEVTKTGTNWVKQLDSSYFTVNTRQVEVPGEGNPGGGNPGKGQDQNPAISTIEVNDTSWYYIYTKTPVDSPYTITETDTTNISYKGSHQFTYLSVPFTMGIERNLTGNLYFKANTGPVVDLRISSQGKIYNPLKQSRFEEASEVPLIKLNMSWLLNAGLYYQLNSNIATAFNFTYMQGLQSIFSPDFPFKYTNRNLSFSLGLKYFISASNRP